MSVFLCLTAVLVVLVLKHPLWNVQMSISSRAVAVAFRRSVGATRPGALRPLLGSQVNRYVGGSQTDYVGLQSPHFGQRRGVSSTHPALDTAGPAPAQERLYEDPRIQILEAALAQVAKHGWKDTTLAAGATALGFPSLSHGMFMRGPIELVEYYLEKVNKEWMAVLDERKEELSTSSPRERIRLGIEMRLRSIAPVVSTWPEALALGLLPQNLEGSAKHIAVLADELCHRAGKDAVDLAWYKDRALVAGVYISTELFFLTDYSEDYQDTWEFLDRRLDDMENMERSPQSLGDGAHAIRTATTAMMSAVGAILQPTVLQAVQKMPVTGTAAVIMQTLVANLVSMAPPVPSPDGLTPMGTKMQSAEPQDQQTHVYPPPPEEDPYEVRKSDSTETHTKPIDGSALK